MRAAKQIKQRGGGGGEGGGDRIDVEQTCVERIPGERMLRVGVQFVRPRRLAGRMRRGDGEREGDPIGRDGAGQGRSRASDVEPRAQPLQGSALQARDRPP